MHGVREHRPRPAALTAATGTAKPVAVLAGLPAAVDQAAAARLRGRGPGPRGHPHRPARAAPPAGSRRAPGTELALGIVRDPALGPLPVMSAGGVLVEIMAERAVLLVPVTRSAALAALRRLRIAPVLPGSRGQPAADLGAVADAITGLSRLACDLGNELDAWTSTRSSAPPPAPSPSTPS